jgi:hypothetical protein
MYGGFQWGNVKGRKETHVEDTGIHGGLLLKWILTKWDRAWTGFTYLRIWENCGLL